MREATTRIDELAADIGRLRKRFNSNPEWTGAYLADRLACHVQDLALILEPTAGQLTAWHAPGDDTAVKEAIRLVDARHQRLLQLLGEAA
jgi:hypothetical protein